MAVREIYMGGADLLEDMRQAVPPSESLKPLIEKSVKEFQKLLQKLEKSLPAEAFELVTSYQAFLSLGDCYRTYSDFRDKLHDYQDSDTENCQHIAILSKGIDARLEMINELSEKYAEAILSILKEVGLNEPQSPAELKSAIEKAVDRIICNNLNSEIKKGNITADEALGKVVEQVENFKESLLRLIRISHNLSVDESYRSAIYMLSKSNALSDRPNDKNGLYSRLYVAPVMNYFDLRYNCGINYE